MKERSSTLRMIGKEMKETISIPGREMRRLFYFILQEERSVSL